MTLFPLSGPTGGNPSLDDTWDATIELFPASSGYLWCLAAGNRPMASFKFRVQRVGIWLWENHVVPGNVYVHSLVIAFLLILTQFNL
jgi:hypothetical protein